MGNEMFFDWTPANPSTPSYTYQPTTTALTRVPKFQVPTMAEVLKRQFGTGNQVIDLGYNYTEVSSRPLLGAGSTSAPITDPNRLLGAGSASTPITNPSRLLGAGNAARTINAFEINGKYFLLENNRTIGCFDKFDKADWTKEIKKLKSSGANIVLGEPAGRVSVPVTSVPVTTTTGASAGTSARTGYVDNGFRFYEHPGMNNGNTPVNPGNTPVNPENRPVNPENRPVNPENRPVNPENRPVNPENTPANSKPTRAERLREIRNNPAKRARYNRLKLAQNPALKARYDRMAHFKKVKGLKKAGWITAAIAAVAVGATLLSKCSDDKKAEDVKPADPAKPVADQPAAEQPAVEQPAVEQPAVEQPAAPVADATENIIQNGDALETVANRYGVTVEQLKELNADKIKKFTTVDGRKVEGFLVGEDIKLPESAKKVDGLRTKEEAISDYEEYLRQNLDKIPQTMWNQLCTPEFRRKNKIGEYKEAA